MSLTQRLRDVFTWTRRGRQDAEASTVGLTDAEEDYRPFELRSLNVVFVREKINLVCGPTGSGKSSCE